MSQAVNTTPVDPKAPSLKSRATAIFAAKLVERSQGLFASNKDFRSATLLAMETELNVTRASASTMYNTAKKEAEAADANIGLGRDPKKVKAPSSGKRGRPQGSKNKAKVVVDSTEVVAPTEAVAPVADAVA